MRKNTLIALAILLNTTAAMTDAEARDLAATVKVQIAAQPLSSALLQLAAQAEMQIMTQGVNVRDLATPGLSGEMTVREALQKLLNGSGLTFRQLGEDTVGLVPIADTSKSSAAHSDDLHLARMDAPSGSQQSADVATKDPTVDEVTIKTRKPFTDENVDIVRSADDVQPYHIIDSRAIEQSGAANVEQFLKQSLSMNTVGLSNSQQTPNAFGNISSINLRGLGANHTLVLINGRRTAAINSLGNTAQPDVNAIPAGAIDRIEVLPSSAAAIYGGAAVGGVVNIVLKHDYDGGEIKAAQDSTLNASAPIRTYDATFGTSFEEGKTHFLIAGHYSEADPLLNQDRPELLQRGLNLINLNSPNFFASGSPFTGGTTPNIASQSGGPLVLKPQYGGGSLGSRITSVPTGASAGTSLSDLAAGLLANAGNYNYELGDTADGRRGLLGQTMGAPTVKSVLTTLRRKWGERLETFAEFSLNENSSRTSLAPFSGASVVVPETTATNPFAQNVTVNVVDPTQGRLDSEVLSRRLTAGFTLTLPYDWRSEADYTWSSSRFSYVGAIRDSAKFSGDIRNGTLNPFVDTLTNPMNLSAYLGTYGVSFPSTLNDVGVRLAGPIFYLPAGASTLTVGLEHRKEGFHDGYYYTSFPNDSAQSVRLLFPGQSQTANSAYLEGAVPLIAPANSVPGINQLDLQAAARTEHFSVSTGTTYVVVGSNAPIVESSTSYTATSETIGFRYKPVATVALRVSYGTAFLPPDYSQLLAPVVGLNNVGGQNATITVIDPLRGNTPVSVSYVSGGNPALKPEQTRNWNIGLIWEPQVLPGLRANVEWYRFNQTNVPVTPTAQSIVDTESQFPGRVTRAPVVSGDPYGVGAITRVDYSIISASKARTDGFDVALGYRMKTDSWGTFDFGLGATRITRFEQQRTFNGTMQDLLNQVNNGGPLKMRGNTNFTWTRSGWRLGWTTSFYGAYPQYAGPGDAYILAQGSDHIPSQMYHSMFAGYRFDPQPGSNLRFLSGVAIEGGIKNVFNKIPPFDAYPGNLNNYYSPFGDPRLRSLWVSLAKSF